MAFQKTLEQNFIDALNQLHDQPASWWRKLVDSSDVFLAIRNNYINAYSCGMSIGKIVHEGRSIRLLVHEEYLTLTGPDPYVDLLAAQTSRTRQVVFDEKGYLAHLSRIKKRAGRFAGDERKGTNKVACRVLTVLDMEAAFEDRMEEPDPENEQEVLADRGRMDLIVLAADLRLVVVEAKLYANGELRAKGTPKVCSQLEEYHRFLTSQRQSLEAAYRNVVSIFGRLRGGFFEKRAGHPNWVKGMATPASISIDPVPRLLIFGFDELQKRGIQENAAQIQSHVTIPGFDRGSVIAVGGTTSIKEAHLA
ncbi:hypothetical protein [Fimbriiglobus ruber]|uniref:Uncharacterized protein n=1 Tax=Fimbriiglobus ruber TaxID=1908690 RepID=A0A225CZN1_9BACT|nr:hypothetical protein [Fimbriiglobus ruber]OWK34133.1 hypothetical protein FRUB_10104 [Fimbriiglobus ruber]